MSVLMLFRVQGDASKLETMARENPTVLPEIAEKARSYGCIRHRFFATNDELLVVDEWPTPDDFQRFFKDSPEIAEMMAKVGVTTEPSITFARKLDLGDEVG